MDKLKGKELNVYNRNRSYRMFVADIDFEKGITIKHIEDVEHGCDFCLNREDYKDNSLMAGKTWKEHFSFWVEEIKKGEFNGELYINTFCKGGGCGATSCAF
jgi:hypothetical protein